MITRRAASQLLAATAAATALGEGAAPAFADKANDTLHVAWDAEIDNADACFNTNRDGILLARMVWGTGCSNAIPRPGNTCPSSPPPGAGSMI